MSAKLEDTKCLVEDMKKAKSGMEAALRRIEALESTLKMTASDLNKLQEAFGGGLKIYWYYNGGFKDISLSLALADMQERIKKVNP